MQIPFGKISGIILAGATLALGQQQQPSPTSPPPVEPAPVTSGSNPVQTSASAAPSDSSAALDYLFNRKPQDGSAGKQMMDANSRANDQMAAQDALGVKRQEDPAVRARFERYLNTREISQAELSEYFSSMKKTSEMLRNNQIFEAWKSLYVLAEYQMIDAAVSRELANRIESIWNTDRATVSLDKKNDQLRKEAEDANWNADLLSNRIQKEDAERQRQQARVQKNQNRQQGQNTGNSPNGGVPSASDPTQQPPDMSGLQGKLQLTEEYLRSLELKARIKINQLKQEQLFDQAKKNFSEYVSTLYNSGRFNHVVLAADFYRKIFQEDEYPVDMANQVNASLEINRDVQAAVDVFRYKAAKNQLSGATDSLQEAFNTSELNPAVLGLERKEKERVAGFNQQLDQMRNLIEARDFGNLETLLAEIKKTTTDFDTTKPMAMVNAVKLESKMRMGKAKLAAQQGDLKLAMEEFQAAAQAWPGNPDLEDKAGLFFETQDVKSQSLAEFDRLAKEQNYRAIFDQQIAFAPAIKGDAKREEELKKALTAIKDAEVASEKANALVINGDVYGAWEAIELASENLPDDKKLNKLRADLSGRSAEFVSAVNKARDAEGRNEAGYSLTWYVNAQRQYPASRIANEGIERLSKKLLGQNN